MRTTRPAKFQQALGIALLTMLFFLGVSLVKTFSSSTFPALLSFSKSNKPRAVIHIGPHKTGSSYIQAMMCNASDILVKRGWTVPVCGMCSAGCFNKHFAGLAFSLQGWKDRVSRFACTEDAIGCFETAVAARPPGHSIFFSSEEFDNLKREGVEKLAGLLEGFQVTIVMFYREKVRHAMSYYSENNKMRASTLGEFLVKITKRSPSGLDFVPLYSLYATVFGRSNIKVFSYDELLRTETPLMQAIVQDVLGVPDYVERTHELLNVGGQKAVAQVAVAAFLSNVITLQNGGRLMSNCIHSMVAQEGLDEVFPLACSSYDHLFDMWTAREEAFIAQYSVALQPAATPPEEDKPQYCEVDVSEIVKYWRSKWSINVTEAATRASQKCNQTAS